MKIFQVLSACALAVAHTGWGPCLKFSFSDIIGTKDFSFLFYSDKWYSNHVLFTEYLGLHRHRFLDLYYCLVSKVCGWVQEQPSLFQLKPKVKKMQCFCSYSAKGQVNSEWIYKVIVSPKMPTTNFPDFFPERVEQKSGNFLIGILGKRWPHKFILNLTDL